MSIQLLKHTAYYIRTNILLSALFLTILSLRHFLGFFKKQHTLIPIYIQQGAYSDYCNEKKQSVWTNLPPFFSLLCKIAIMLLL